jgi:hypothetical protein
MHRCGHLSLVKWFVERGAAIDTIANDTNTGGIRSNGNETKLRSSALLCALWSPRPMRDRQNLIVYLLDNKANINARTQVSFVWVGRVAG